MTGPRSPVPLPAQARPPGCGDHSCQEAGSPACGPHPLAGSRLPPRPRGQHRGSGSLDSTSCHQAWIERQRGDRGSQDTCKTRFLPRRPLPLPAPLPLVCSGRFQWEWVGEGAGREKTRPRLPQRSHSKQGGCASPGKPAGLRLRPRPSSGYFPGQVQATSPLRGQVQTAVGKPATLCAQDQPSQSPGPPLPGWNLLQDQS